MLKWFRFCVASSKMNFCVVLALAIIIFLNRVKAQEGADNIIGDLDLIDADLVGALSSVNLNEICEFTAKEVRDDVCYKQLAVVCENEDFKETMLDAASKFPYSGMQVKTNLDLGMYDECVDLDSIMNKTRVVGKYCLASVIIPSTALTDSDFFEKAYKLSTCLPDQCSAKYILEILNLSYVYPLFNDDRCSTKESFRIMHWDAYLAIIFFASIMLLLIISTVYDLYFYFTNKDYQNIVFQSFSMFHNGRKLIKASKMSGEQIYVIHGVRVISMMWIIAGHAFSSYEVFPSINLHTFKEFEWSQKSFYITTAHLAVDTFLFLSGFLLAYQYLKGKPKSLLGQIKTIPSMVIHRYIRLTPVAATAFIVMITLFVHFGDGPIYKEVVQVEKDKCIKYWWSYFLYVQNYVNYNDVCLINTWYLSVDWQLFLISPIVLIPVASLVKSNFKWVMLQLFGLNIIFTIAPVVIKFLLHDHENLFETHNRFNDYFIGIMLGVYMREKNDIKLRISSKWNLITWSFCLVSMCLITWLYKELQLMAHYKNDESVLTYVTILRTFWCMCLAWVIYACQQGHGGIINWLLTTPLIQFLSKLTYCMYIIHVAPLYYLNSIIRQPVYLSQISTLADAIATYMVTIVMAVIWTLAFESPLINLEKHFMRKL